MIVRGLAVVLALAACGPVLGQSAAPVDDGIKVYGAETLNPGQIRSCLKLDQQLVEQEHKVSEYEATLSGYREKISALRADLQARRKAIDSADPAAVSDFNGRVDRHREMTATYNDQFVPTLEKRRARLNELVAGYNERCANKGYFEEDWLAALQELGLPDPRKRSGG